MLVSKLYSDQVRFCFMIMSHLLQAYGQESELLEWIDAVRDTRDNIPCPSVRHA